MTYSIPEKRSGQHGVKINDKDGTIRIKSSGDKQAVGKCKEFLSSEGAKIRLFVVDEIVTHKQRARTQKSGVK